MNAVQLMLTEITGINEKYKKIAEVTGSNFNVFNILNISTDEVKHSKFIAELLSKRGLHNQRNLFLILFIKCLLEENEKFSEVVVLKQFDIENYLVIVEEDIGEINFVTATGGRLDIVLKDSLGNVIIIENKIYASDQSQQLKRYKNKYPKSLLFYLTLDGKKPSEESVLNLEKEQDYFCISYKNEIISWIEKCIQLVIHKPFIRENLTQYSYIIKLLTNQAETMEQSNEVASVILKNVDNYFAAEKVAGEFDKAKYNLLFDFWKEVKEEIEKEYPTKKVRFTKDDFVKEAISAIFIEEDGKATIGIEPLNGMHPQKRFCNLYIGYFSNESTPDKSGPFAEWSNVVSYESLNFSNNDTLTRIIINRKELISEIVNKIKQYQKL